MVFGSVPFVLVGRCCGFAENKVAVCLFFFRLLSVSSIFSCGVFLACAFCLCQVVRVELPVFFVRSRFVIIFRLCFWFSAFCLFLLCLKFSGCVFFCLVFALFAWLRFW